MPDSVLGLYIAAGLFAVFVVIPTLLSAAIYILAKNDVFFTFPIEGRVKSVERNGVFHKFILAYKGHDFRGTGDGVEGDDIRQWGVIEHPTVRDTRNSIERILGLVPFLREIRWVGVYPFAKIKEMRFTWTSREQKVDLKTGQTVSQLITSEEVITSVLVQADMYAFVIPSAGTREGVPLDVEINFRGVVVNPYKAMYRVQHWLEFTVNRLNGEIRPLIGRMSFAEVNSLTEEYDGYKEEVGDDGKKKRTPVKRTRTINIDDKIEETQALLLEKYGVEIKRVQIVEASPSSEEAQEAVAAQAQVYIAEQQARAINIKAEAERDRATKYWEKVSEIPGGSGMLAAEALRDSKVTAYAPSGNGRGLMPVIDVSAEKKPSGTPPQKG